MVMPRRQRNRRDGLGRQRRAAEVGVQHRAGEVVHRPERCPRVIGQPRSGTQDDVSLGERLSGPGPAGKAGRVRAEPRRSQRVELRAQGRGDRGASMDAGQRAAVLAAQQAIQRRNGGPLG